MNETIHNIMVVCPKIKTCPRSCISKKAHRVSDCNPCPFDSTLKCIAIKGDRKR